MVIVMEHSASEENVQKVIEALVEVGYDVHRSSGVDFTVLGAVGVPHRPVDPRLIEVLPGVREVVRVSEPYKLAGRTFKAEDTIVDVAGVLVGGTEVIVMAGPCSVESAEQVGIVAKSVAASGARILRGGAFKPRTSPYSFQGYGEEALKWMRAAADASGMAVVSEVMDVRHIEMMMRYVDCLQVGARNMQNFDLLKELGRVRRPVLLKRGLSATIEEWLLSAEYVLAGGNGQVILCERGIRTFETYTRNTLDISAIPVVKKRSHLPIVVDPSHGTGRREKVIPMGETHFLLGSVVIEPGPELGLRDEPRRLAVDRPNCAEVEILGQRQGEGLCLAVLGYPPEFRMAASCRHNLEPEALEGGEDVPSRESSESGGHSRAGSRKSRPAWANASARASRNPRPRGGA